MDKPTTKPVLAAIIIVLAVGALLVVFTNKETSNSATSQNTEVIIQGSGSSFLYPQMQNWISEFEKMNPSIKINYNPTGSGTGQNQFLQGVVDFAGSDPPLKSSVWSQYKGGVLQVPVILGGVAVVYNVPGVKESLNLTGEVIAKIYKGDITYWDDTLITQLNPGVNLPHKEIIAVHRSDSSGTTNVFTLFLHKSSPSSWPLSLVGKSIEWPVDSKGRGVGGKGNQGVTEQVKQTQYSIGYIELAYAFQAGLPYAKIENSAGNFVLPTPENVEAAARAALHYLPSDPAADWSSALDAIVYAPGSESYPITTFSFLILHKHYNDPNKAKALAEFLNWISDNGYNQVVKGYVPIPPSLRDMIKQAATTIEG